MMDCYWKSFFVLAVLQTAVAFKIPGNNASLDVLTVPRFPTSKGNRSPTPPTAKPPTANDTEYMGPVFIIRELNKEKGEYDALIATGGIQVMLSKWPGADGRVMTPRTVPKPPGTEHLEDSEFFSMLVTPETVKMLNYPANLGINVTLAALLTAASTRMPWLIVMRRSDYPQLFENKENPTVVVVAAAGIPGMQVPQRRRYSTRQRRGLYAVPQYRQHAEEADDQQPATGHTFSPSFERQLLSTMCYNFVRDYASAGAHLPRLPITLAEPEVTAADHSRSRDGPLPPQTEFRSDDEQSSSSNVEMTVPQRRVVVS